MRTLEDETDHVHFSLASSWPYIGSILKVSMVVGHIQLKHLLCT